MSLLAPEIIAMARGLSLDAALMAKIASGRVNTLTLPESDALLAATSRFEKALPYDDAKLLHELRMIAAKKLQRESVVGAYHQERRGRMPISQNTLLTPEGIKALIRGFTTENLSSDWRHLPYPIPSEVDPRLTVDAWAHREVINHRCLTDGDLRNPKTRVLVALAPINDFDNDVEFEGQRYQWNGYDFYEAESFVNSSGERLTGPSPSYAMEFLRRNLPAERGVEFIIPKTFEEYEAAVRSGSFDLVCLSGLGKNTRVLLKMNALARECGAREVWLGNYAALGPYTVLKKTFDRQFSGFGEEYLYHNLVGDNLPPRRFHPEADRMMSTVQVLRPASKDPSIPTSEMPVVQSTLQVLHMAASLGCNRPCNYCAERFWSGGVQMVSEIDELKSIVDRALELGADHVYFLDPNFGIKWQAGDESAIEAQIVNYISQQRTSMARSLTFSILTEVDTIKKHGQYLIDRGLVKVFLGIESLSDVHANGDLSSLGRKKQSIGETIDIVRWMQARNVMVNGLYMQGTPGETEEEMMGGAARLAQLLENSQVSTFTPFPGTDIFFIGADALEIHDYDPDCGLFYGFMSAAFNGKVTDPAVGRRVFFKTQKGVNDVRRPNGLLDTILRRTQR